ncbi:YwqH-like family protein [Bacillus sp. SJS]|uniref:YwqH-like family protein n=1 Tax=Bacillus sp. SJS TaxID=1423321 RepID=UPI0004DD2958|nr:DUF5082 family protein [Bacillus sp. SJS]KZZ84137.1 hypothetical protein AS29_013165 [Bacillus sp. SJS]
MFGESMSELRQQLAKKEQELTELENAATQLEEIYQDFLDNEKLISEPILGAKTWSGKAANKFNAARGRELTEAYREVYLQLVQAYRVVIYCINETKEDIASLKSKIVQLEEEVKLKALNA